MIRFVDTHCHLTHGRLRQQLEAAMERAKEAGVAACVCAAGNLDESRAGRDLAGTHREVWFMAGVHPHEAKNAAPGYPAEIEQLAADPKCVAIGETGLDYHYDFSPRADQQRVFAEQLDLARRLGKPVVIHTREAFEDTLAILNASCVEGGRALFHSFTEGPDRARQALDFGAMISFSGIVTFKPAEALRQTAAIVPIERILIETDAPYLSPEPVRKMKTNEPANVAYVAGFLAALRGMPLEQFAQITTASAARFFGLDVSLL
jgi:TatD DNase family protein